MEATYPITCGAFDPAPAGVEVRLDPSPHDFRQLWKGKLRLQQQHPPVIENLHRLDQKGLRYKWSTDSFREQPGGVLHHLDATRTESGIKLPLRIQTHEPTLDTVGSVDRYG